MPERDRADPSAEPADGSKRGHATPKGNDDLALLEEGVRRAGDIALRYFRGRYRRWSKEGGSPVTEADLAVDGFLRNELLGARPDYGWLSEETVDNPGRLGRNSVFVVDPIDGTVAFMKGRPHFSICAAVVKQERSVAGVVFNPVTGECFAASSGGGAFLNGTPIHASAMNRIAGARLLGNKGLFAAWPFAEVANFSSIAYRMALVAAGRYDAMVSLTVKHDWDLAGADIILSEAGGRLVDGNGNEPRYNRAEPVQGPTIAAGGALVAPLLAELRARKLLPSGADSL